MRTLSFMLLATGILACVELQAANTSGGGGAGGGAASCAPSRVCAPGFDCGPCKTLDISSRWFGPTQGVQYVQDVELGPTGDILLVGSFSQTIDLGTGTPFAVFNDNGPPRPFAALLGSDGKGKWITDLGVTDTGNIREAYIEPTDGSVVLGGVQDFTGGITKAMVYRLTPAGDVIWSVGFSDGETAPNNEILAVARDASGDVLAAGFVLGSFSISCGPEGGPAQNVSVSGTSSLLVVKLAKDTGACRWAATASGGQSFPTGITNTPNGQVVVVGLYDGGFNVAGTLSLPAPNGSKGFVLALNGDTGKPAWGKAFVGTTASASVLPGRIAVVSETELVLTGSMLGGAMDFGDSNEPQILSGGTGIEPYVVGLDFSGKTLWARRFLAKNTRGTSIAATTDESGATALYVGAFGIEGAFQLDEADESSTVCTNGGLVLMRIDPITGEPRYASCFNDFAIEGSLASRIAFVAANSGALVLGGSVVGPVQFGSSSYGSLDELATTMAYVRFSPLP